MYARRAVDNIAQVIYYIYTVQLYGVNTCKGNYYHVEYGLYYIVKRYLVLQL